MENEEETKEEDGDTQVRSRKDENKANKTNDVGDKTNRSDAGKESTTVRIGSDFVSESCQQKCFKCLKSLSNI